jgi:hypothetical protein
MNNYPSTNPDLTFDKPKEEAGSPNPDLNKCIDDLENLLLGFMGYGENCCKSDNDVSYIDKKIKESLTKLHSVTECCNGSLTPKKADYIYSIVFKLTGIEKTKYYNLPHDFHNYVLHILIAPCFQRDRMQEVLQNE